MRHLVLVALGVFVVCLITQAADSGCVVSKTISWTYRGITYSYKIELSCTDFLRMYDLYAKKSRTAEYHVYIDDPSVAQLWRMPTNPLYGALNYLIIETNKYRLDFVEKANFFASFVQNIQYVPDPTGGEVRKFPLETLLLGGDCEDKAILLAWLLRKAGFKVAIIEFSDHVGAGVSFSVDPKFPYEAYYFPYGTHRYYYLECSAPQWFVGQMPEKYKKASARIYPIN